MWASKKFTNKETEGEKGDGNLGRGKRKVGRSPPKKQRPKRKHQRVSLPSHLLEKHKRGKGGNHGEGGKNKRRGGKRVVVGSKKCPIRKGKRSKEGKRDQKKEIRGEGKKAKKKQWV